MTAAARLVPGFLAVALFTLAGLGVEAALPGLRRRPLAERLGLAFLLGVAAIGTGSWLLSLVAHVPVGGPLAIALALVLAGAGAARHARLGRRGTARTGGVPRLARAATALAGTLGALVTLAVIADALAGPLADWDGRMTWAARGRQIQAERTVRPGVLLDAQAVVAWPRYPILVPVAQAIVLDLVPDPADDRAVRLLHAFYLPAFLAVTWGAARRLAGPVPAALVTLALASAPFPAFAEDGGARGAYADLPLAAFTAAGLFLLVEARGGSGPAVAGGLLLGAAVLTKNEGTPLALGALSGTALLAFTRLRTSPRHAGRRRRLLAPAFGGLVAIALAAALLAAWRSGIPPRREADYLAALSLPALASGLATRTEATLREATARLMDPARWGILWATLPVLLLAGFRGLANARTVPLLAVPAASGAVFLAACAVTAGPLVALVDATVHRFALHAVAPLLCVVALAVRHGLSASSGGRP